MYPFVKRGIDISGAFILLCLFIPVLAIVAILIRVKLGNPILFKQQRPGRGNHPFIIYKFRTMKNLYDSEGRLLPDYMRYVKLGGIIRKLSLDELPQLINVLKGEMSLIGPRPLLMKYSPYYTDRERSRFDVRPGMTGLAQISGRNNLSWNERLGLDATYVEQLSLRLDMAILWKTVVKVIRQEDVVENPGLHELSLDDARMSVKEGSA